MQTVKDKQIIYYLYLHTFPNNKVYVGITSHLPEYRWGKDGGGYLQLNKKGKPTQPKMYYAVQKYGWENIKHEILFMSESKEFIEIMERKYITEIYHSNNIKFGYNIDNGGKGCGRYTPERLERLSKRFSKENNPAFGKKWWTNGIERILSETCPDGFYAGTLPKSRESIEKGAKKLKEYYKNAPKKKWYNNGFEQALCETCPEGWTKGMLPMPKEIVEKVSLQHVGMILYNNGKERKFFKEDPGEGWVKGDLPRSDERKNALKGIPLKESTKEKLRQYCGENSKNTGKKWWNNGKIQTMSIECPGENFIEGRLPVSEEFIAKCRKRNAGKNNPAFGRKWWNNGVEQKFQKECPGENWLPGHLSFKRKK